MTRFIALLLAAFLLVGIVAPIEYVEAAGTLVQGDDDNLDGTSDDTTTLATAATSITHTFRLTATAGNMLALCFGGDKDVGAITTPTGWNLAISDSSTDVSIAGFWKVADGTETSVTVQYGTSRLSALHLVEWSGLDNFDGSAGVFSDDPPQNGASTSSRSSGSVTNTDTNGARSLACIASDSGANTNAGINWTNGYTQLFYSEDGAGGAPGLAVAELDIVSGTGARETTFSTTGSDQMSGINMVFDNSGGAGPSSSAPQRMQRAANDDYFETGDELLLASGY